MDIEQQRLALAGLDGWKGCTDVKCIYRSCQHLHRNEVVAFPEWYSIKRYPDYPNDLNALHLLLSKLKVAERWSYVGILRDIVERDARKKVTMNVTTEVGSFPHVEAEPNQKSEALLKVKKLWKNQENQTVRTATQPTMSIKPQDDPDSTGNVYSKS